MTATRRNLPNRRRNNTFPVQVEGMAKPMLMTVGYFENGDPAEVFVSDIKAGTTMDAVARDAAVLLSIGLQYGVPLETFGSAVTRNSAGDASSVMGELIDRLIEDGRQPPDPAPSPVIPPKPPRPGPKAVEPVVADAPA